MLLPLTLGLPGKPALAADNQVVFTAATSNGR
jgi:hypothetical protein